MDSYFTKSKYIKELSPSDFDSILVWKLKSKKCSIILWYAPWCPHCKSLKNIWEKLGKTVKNVDVLAFNCEKYKNHLLKIQEDIPELIRGYPTIIIYKKGDPDEQFDEERTLENLLKTLKRICQR